MLTRLARHGNRWRPALRLAARDAARHRARTVLATLLVALPIAALVGGTALMASTPPDREAALASIPDGVQAVLTATAITRGSTPFEQVPEGAPAPWVDDLEQVPASEAELTKLLPAGNRLLPFWNSSQLLVTTGIDLKPGDESDAGASVMEGIDLAGVSTATMTEAGGDALDLLLPAIDKGKAPHDDADVVVTSVLAKRLNVTLGDTVTFVAPPFNGWFSSDGRIGEAIQDTQRAYRISGIVDSEASTAWARDAWISRIAAVDPAGVDGHWLVVGDEPVTWQDAKAINALQAFAVSRHVLTHYPSADELYPVPVDIQAVVLQIVTIVLTGALGTLLVLFLVTPAFAVSIDQSRRTLGLAAATGGTPSDLRRIVTAQGLVVGFAGGVLGALVGVAATPVAGRAIWPERNLIAHFPWWILPVGIGIAAALGIIATLFPANAASSLQPVDALKDRPTPRPGRAGRGRLGRRIGAALGPFLLIAAVLTGALSLAFPRPEASPGEPPGTLPPSALVMFLLLLLCLALSVGGLLLTVRAITSYGARVASRLPVAFRLALRDASDHRSRFLPAATAVLIAVCAASYLAVLSGSTIANNRDGTGEMVTGGRIVLGAHVSVSTEFDRLVLTDAIAALADELPVTGSEPVFSLPSNDDDAVFFGALPPADRWCPEDRYPDTASAITVGAPLTCTDWEHAYAPSLTLPWMGGSDDMVMSGDALRASGLAGAEKAADVLDAGGVVVNNAAMLSADGTVRVAIGPDPIPDENTAERIVEIPGAFVRGFAPLTTVSKETARTLGITKLEYVGEYPLLSRELTLGELDRARQIVESHTTLAWFGEPRYQHPWGGDDQLVVIGLLAALAVLATAISLMLAKTQSRRDFATMHAVGATPPFLRRFAFTQAVVVLAAGLPLGLAAGIALGAYQVSWNRKAAIDGAWLEMVPLWDVQFGILLAVLGAGMLTALLIARPPRQIVRRAID